MHKRLLTEMTDEELMEFERLLIRAENALKQKKPMTEPVYQIAMAEGSTSTAWIDVAKNVFDDAGMYPEYKRRALYTRPELEAETIETLKAENFKLASGQCTEGGPWGDEGGTPYCKYAEPARKPMTDEEILELYNQCEEETSVHSTIFHFDKFARAIEARGIVLRPLNKKQIEKAFEDTGYGKGDSRQTCFIQGIRFAEKHHGITDA